MGACAHLDIYIIDNNLNKVDVDTSNKVNNYQYSPSTSECSSFSNVSSNPTSPLINSISNKDNLDKISLSLKNIIQIYNDTEFEKQLNNFKNNLNNIKKIEINNKFKIFHEFYDNIKNLCGKIILSKK